MFLFYCFHIFGFGFQILFFGLVILFFWFWVLVKCKKWFIFCIWFCFFYIFYFNFILANRLASPFLFGPLFYSAPYFIRSPPFIQSIKTKLFLFVIHSLLLLLQVVLVSRRPSIVRTCKNVLELRNYAKHTINAIILLW